MKIKSLISLAIFAAFIVSCEKDMKWINPDDSKADQSEIVKICAERSAECGMIEYEYLGKTRKVFCGKCEEDYDCNTSNKCEKIGGDNDPVSDDSDTDTKPDEDIVPEPTEPTADPTNPTTDPTTEPTDTQSCTTIDGNMWSPKASSTMKWSGAVDYCNNLTACGYSDWHLPTISELRTLIKNCSGTVTGGGCGVTDSCVSLSCWNDPCSGCPNDSTGYYSKLSDIGYFWSSSTISDETDAAWSVGFYNGLLFSGDKNDQRSSVRCVRNTGGEEGRCVTAGGNWNGSQCTRTQNCSAKPANSDWNGDSSYTQEYASFGWTFVNTIYSEDAGVCHFKCVTDYVWDGSACVSVNPCNPNPCSSISNSTGICTATSATNYSCGCNGGYYWWGIEKGCIDTPLTLGKICTGQTSCYNASSSMICPTSSSADFYGQDAQYTSKCVAQSFTLGTGAQTGTVIDNNTGLIWEQSPSEGTYTWDDAPNHCADLNSSNFGGKNNWRVPNPLEFMTIVDNSKYNPATNSNFTNMPTDYSTYLWTSKEYKGDTSDAYYFSPLYGSSGENRKTKTYQVLCVSGDEMLPATSADFTTMSVIYEYGLPVIVAKAEVVTDSKTGLMWQKEYVTGKTWQEALKYCEDSNYAGYFDWRLPNENELASLVNYEKGQPYSYFPDMPSSYFPFWSSSTDVYTAEGAGVVKFFAGDVSSGYKTDKWYVRCVRNADEEILDENSDEDTDSEPDNEPDEDEIPVADDDHNPIVDEDETPDEILDMDEIDDSDNLPTHYTLGNICTGQDKCYANSGPMTCPVEGEDFFGQDAQYTGKCTAQSFTPDTDKGIIIDNNTGLTWERSPSSGTYTWDDAPNHCADLNSSNFGGKSNWRVPNPLEFMTIVDNSRYNPATNSNFTGMPTSDSTYLWTSAEYKGNTSYAYVFSPYYGYYYGYSDDPDDPCLKTKTYQVLCVGGDEMQPATSSDFTTQTISGKVVVTDSKTGLMWQKKEYETKRWQQALKYCEELTYAGYSDWRLPNKNELASLINYEKSGSPYSYFPDMPVNWFWSSSTRVSSTSRAWSVGFHSGGIVGSLNKTDTNYVRCVR